MNADLIERLRSMRKKGLEAETRDQYTAAGEAFIRSSDEVIETIRALTSERDYLRARIDSAPRAIMDTRVALGLCAPTEADFPALYALQGKRVALVVLDTGDFVK